MKENDLVRIVLTKDYVLPARVVKNLHPRPFWR